MKISKSPARPSRSHSSYNLETLENRKFLSAAVGTIHPDTSIATTTAVYDTSRTTVLGQTITVKGVVHATSGIARGTVELLDNGKDSGLTGTLNHLGYYVFSIDDSHAIFLGTDEYRIRYLSEGSFVGSKSKQLAAKVVSPSLTTESDGLELATVTQGTGTAKASTGNTVVVQYTVWNQTENDAFLEDSGEVSPGTFSFVIDQSNVYTGFNEEVKGMKVGECRVGVLPSNIAANDGNTLVFAIRLVSIS